MFYDELLIELFRFLFWLKPKNKNSEFSLVEVMALTVLYKNQCDSKEDMLPSKLSKELGLSRSALSPILNELEKKGCIHRVLDEKDRRQIIVQLKMNPNEFMSERKNEIIKMLSVLSDDDTKQLYEYLKKMNNSIENSNYELKKG